MQLIILLFLAAFAAADIDGNASQQKHTYHSPEPFTRSLRGLLKSWADRYPMVRNLIDAQVTALPFNLQQMIREDHFVHFSQSPAMQAFEGVESGSFDSVIGFLGDSLEISGDKRDAFLESMEFIKNADNSDWSLVDIIYDVNDGVNCKYVSILGHKNLEQSTFDFIVADFKSSFQLASKVLFIEEHKSQLWGLAQTGEIRTQRIPANLKLRDVALLKTFLSQAALVRFAEMFEINVSGAAFSGSAINALIDAGVSIMPKIISGFKTTSTSSIIREIAGQGFSHFAQSALTYATNSVLEKDVFSIFIPRITQLVRIEGDVLEGAKAALEIGMYSETGTWNDFKIAFNDKAAVNTVQFVDIVCHSIGDKKYNIVMVNVAQTFKLAPNVKYIEHSKSYVGGLYSETKIVRKEYPRSLTENDLKALMGFFHITAFKKLAETFGRPMPKLPEKPELKP